MENLKKQDNSINILKCFGILTVVFGHIGFSVSGHGNRLHTMVYFYHMPLFFFISGYLYKSYSIKTTIVKNIKSLYIPFILWSFIFICMRNIFLNFGFYSSDNMQNLNQLISKQTFINVFTFKYNEPLLGAIWFIPCLFFVRIIYCFIDKLIDNIKFISDSKEMLMPFIIVILFIYGLNRGINGEFLNYQLDVVFVAMLFYYIGIKYKELKDSIPIKLTIAIPLLLIMWQNVRFGFIDMNNRSYINAAFFLFNALSGIYINLSFIKVINWIRNEKIKKITYIIGQSTFWILVLHFTVFKIITLIKINIESLSLDRLQYIFPGDVIGLSWIWILIYLIAGTIIPVIINYCFSLIKRKFLKIAL